MEETLLAGQDAANLIVDEIISQLDKNRGEMTRLEFVSLLIRNRLERYYQNPDHTDEEEIYRFVKAIMELLGHYLEVLFKRKLLDITTMSHYRYVQ